VNQNCGIIQEDGQCDSLGMCDASVVLSDKNNGASLDTEIKLC
jgi:hypothetical protein